MRKRKKREKKEKKINTTMKMMSVMDQDAVLCRTKQCFSAICSFVAKRET
jgi:hypothetical protein